MSDTTTQPIAIVSVEKPCMAYAPRIHAAGCRDIAADRARGYTDLYPATITPAAWLREVFGDQAQDSVDPEDSAAFEAELRYQAQDAVICRCAQKAGFRI